MALPRRLLTVVAASAVALAGFGTLNPLPSAGATPVGDLMISAYVEGSSNNKALELYNLTNSDLNLAGYTVELYTNGGSTPNSTLSLSGTLPSDSHYLIANSQATIFDSPDITHGVANFNRDDAVVLKRGGVVLDSMGQVGVQESWPNMENKSLVKNVCEVDTDPTDAYTTAFFDVSAEGAVDSVEDLGTFTCDPLIDPTDPGDGGGDLPEEPLIGDVQGTTDTSPYVGQTVTLTGVVTASFQGENQFNGYTIQDAGDDNADTSDGIFVYAPGADVRSVGEEVSVTGPVSEFNGQTQIGENSVEVLSTGNDVAPVALTLPITNHESYESMLVTFPDDLVILEFFNFDRFGEIVYGLERQYTPTAVHTPGSTEQSLLAAKNASERIIVDDGRSNQNATPAIHPNGEPFTQENYFRGGDTVAGLTGIMSFNFGEWKLQPTTGGEHTVVNERPEVPDVGGDFKVASFNVLNYFTTLGSRGAVTNLELDRQQAKIVAALAEIDADVVGLMEIENNAPGAVGHLVDGLNAEVGEGTYDYIDTDVQGTDEIFQAIIYKPATAEPAGDFAVLDRNDGRNRPSLTQTFEHIESGELVTVNVNHLKSKGSACSGDPDLGDGAGNCNQTRVQAVEAITDWLATDPTGQGADRVILMGDLNFYDHEQPMGVLTDAGYTDLKKHFHGDHAYSYVFDGQLGYLDYGLANEAALDDVVDAVSWHINADESDLFDYTMQFKQPNESALWAPDPYRSSDHDPIIIGMQLADDGTVDPEPTPTPTPTPTPDPEPEPTPTVTVTVTASPAPGRDLYETPGFHTSDGRRWMTVCEPYADPITRCWTYIWASVVHEQDGQFFQVNGWAFNNLTYIGGDRADWGENPLAVTGSWTTDEGRQWRTECDTEATGQGGCRSYIVATVIERDGNNFRKVTKEVFNNQVRFDESA